MTPWPEVQAAEHGHAVGASCERCARNRHQAGDDSEGCIACWEEDAFEAFPAIPEGPWCLEPVADTEGRCKHCGHYTEAVLVMPAEACE